MAQVRPSLGLVESLSVEEAPPNAMREKMGSLTAELSAHAQKMKLHVDGRHGCMFCNLSKTWVANMLLEINPKSPLVLLKTHGNANFQSSGPFKNASSVSQGCNAVIFCLFCCALHIRVNMFDLVRPVAHSFVTKTSNTL